MHLHSPLRHAQLFGHPPYEMLSSIKSTSWGVRIYFRHPRSISRAPTAIRNQQFRLARSSFTPHPWERKEAKLVGESRRINFMLASTTIPFHPAYKPVTYFANFFVSSAASASSSASAN